MSKFRLAVYYGIESYFDGERFFCSQIHGRYLEEIYRHSGKFMIFSMVADKHCRSKYYGSKEYAVDPEKVEVIRLPYFFSFLSSVKHFFSIQRCFKKNIDKADVFWIRYPQPFGYFLWFFAKRRNKKVFFQLSGDVEEEVKKGRAYRGILRFIALAVVRFEKAVLKRAFKNCLVFIQGQELYKKYSSSALKAVRIITSSLVPEDFYLRSDVRMRDGVKILYVGSLNQEKNIDNLIRALNSLLQRGTSCELSIAGDGPERTKMEKLCVKLGIKSKVKFHGYFPLGPKMKELYKDSDIFILPSVSEGTPRVLLEAMASGVVVVATRVGGIPDIVVDSITGLLVDPDDTEAFVLAVERLIKDPQLRKKLIEKGYEFAREHLLADFVKVVFDNIESFYFENKGNN